MSNSDLYYGRIHQISHKEQYCRLVNIILINLLIQNH